MRQKKYTIYTGRDYGNLRLVIGFARSHLAHERATQKLAADYGITFHQFEVLEALFHLGSLTVGEITKKTLSTGGNTTVVLRNLERDGFITRTRSKGDKRKSVISITEKGSHVIQKMFPNHLKAIEEHFHRLSAEERQTLLSLIRKMNGIKD